VYPPQYKQLEWQRIDTLLLYAGLDNP